MLELSGEIVGRCTLRVTRTDIHLSPRAIFKLVGDYLSVKEEQSPGEREWGTCIGG